MGAAALPVSPLFPGLLPFWAGGALSGLLGATFVLLKRYAIFEAAMKLFIGIMFVVVVGLAILVAPNLGEALGGLVPRLPDGSVIYTLGLIGGVGGTITLRSEEHKSELQSLMRISSAVFCLKKKTQRTTHANCVGHMH